MLVGDPVIWILRNGIGGETRWPSFLGRAATFMEAIEGLCIPKVIKQIDS